MLSPTSPRHPARPHRNRRSTLLMAQHDDPQNGHSSELVYTAIRRLFRTSLWHRLLVPADLLNSSAACSCTNTFLCSKGTVSTHVTKTSEEQTIVGRRPW